MKKNLSTITPKTLNAICNEKLRACASSAQNDRTTAFIALVDGEEAALLCYEALSPSLGFICVIFVLPSFRQQGIGTELLSFADSYAISLGSTNIQLTPYSLDSNLGLNHQSLHSWYTANGYVPDLNNADRLIKMLR